MMWLISILFLIYSLTSVYGTATMKLDLIKFHNKKGYDYDGDHCDDSWFGRTSACDHKFIFCIDDSRSSSSISSCRYWKKKFGPFHNKDKITFNSNPYTIDFNSWPGSVKLKVEVIDHDKYSDNDYVGFLYGYLTTSPSQRTIHKSIEGRQRNHKATLVLSYSYRLYCDRHFYGDSCTTYCEPQNNDIGGHYTCTSSGRRVCYPGWEGSYCTKSVDECRASPCKNGATCHDKHLSFTCSCASGFTGTHCETNIDDCANHKCQNGAACHDLIDAYICACVPGFFGLLCDSDIDYCANVTCSNNGTCLDRLHDYVCHCFPGYTGLLCETEIDECEKVTCKNNGTCNDLINGFNCTCNKGFTGRLCEIDIDDCSDHSCQNGAECQDGVDSYSCACKSGFSGPFCQTDIDDCATNTCQNGATCNDLVNSYRCTCAPGFTGKMCEQNINDCVFHRCMNDAKCEDKIDSYKCLCTEWWSGAWCNIPDLETQGRNDTIVLEGELKKQDLDVFNSAMAFIVDNGTSLQDQNLQCLSDSEFFLSEKKEVVTKVQYKILYKDRQISSSLVENVVSRLSDSQLKELLRHKVYRGLLHARRSIIHVNQIPQTRNIKDDKPWIVSNWYIILILLVVLLFVVLLISYFVHNKRKSHVDHTAAMMDQKSVEFVNELYVDAHIK